VGGCLVGGVVNTCWDAGEVTTPDGFYVYDEPDPAYGGMRFRRRVEWAEATEQDHRDAIERMTTIRDEVDEQIALHEAAIAELVR
jgi:hypothetical protein